MRDQRGFALLVALWLLVVLAVSGLQLSLQARDRRLAAGNVHEWVRARAAADAGLEHARRRLEARLRAAATPGADPALRVDPWADLALLAPEPATLADAGYRIRLADVGAALHLNQASEEELRRLMDALRVDAGEADRLAQAIADWRDADDLHRPRGAERDHYVRAGAAVLPRNAPFHDLNELLHVRGMTPGLLARLRPHLTLLGSGQVNFNTAPAPVLLALPGMTSEAVEVLLRHRRSGRRLASLGDLGPELSPGAREVFNAAYPQLLVGTTPETREVEIRSTGRVTEGHVEVEARALLVRSGETPYLIRRWVR